MLLTVAMDEVLREARPRAASGADARLEFQELAVSHVHASRFAVGAELRLNRIGVRVTP